MTFLEIFENFDTLTVNRRFEMASKSIKIHVFWASFLRISALEVVKIMTFLKKRCSSVYLPPMYPYHKESLPEVDIPIFEGVTFQKIRKKVPKSKGGFDKKIDGFRGV